MSEGTRITGRAVRMTIAIGVVFKIVVITVGNVILGTANPSDIVGIWVRFVPSLLADLVIGWLYVYFHLLQPTNTPLRADVGGKGAFISSLAIHAITGMLAMFFGLCGTILQIGDPSYQEGLTSVAVGLMNLWFSEYRIVLTTRGFVILIGSMLSAVVGALSAPLMTNARQP